MVGAPESCSGSIAYQFVTISVDESAWMGSRVVGYGGKRHAGRYSEVGTVTFFEPIQGSVAATTGYFLVLLNMAQSI
jgi:hypothetical protein